MRKIIFLILFVSVSFIAAQTKYMIYFKDKGIAQSASLQKTSSLYKIAEQQLSSKAIERRKQVMGEDNYITFEDIPLNENYIHQIETLGIKIQNKLKWFNAVSAYMTDGQVSSLKTLSSIQKIEKIHVFKSRNDENQLNESSTNDSNSSINKITSTTGLNYGPSLTQNALSDIPVVHDIGINGNGVIIGILDSGFRWKTHNSLKNLLVLNEKDFIQNDAITENQLGDAGNQDGHGTAVFSIMAGFDQGNIIGPAYGAQFLLAKTEYIPTETNVEEDNYAAALEWMEAQGVHITSSSLGYNLFDAGQRSYTYSEMNGQTTIVAKAANFAFDRGVSTFTAAGNDGSFWGIGKGGLSSPGDAPNMITVGAVDNTNSIASFSSRGPTSDGRIKPEVVAMGVSDRHAIAGSTYGNGNGTSYATPIAAGIGGLLKSTWPHLTNVQIRKIFIECGDRTPAPDNNFGYGLISAKRVVTYPNLSKTNNVYNVINKIFINSNGVSPSSVRLIYSLGGASSQTTTMNYDNVLKYNYTLPISTNGDSVKFYFQYQTLSGLTVKEPSVGIYIFSYGDLMVYYKSTQEIVQQIPSQYQLNQNYPNPFNLGTRIEFQSPTKSPAEIMIYNILGQKVRTLFVGLADTGTNIVSWDTKNDAGWVTPSGPYFYVLTIQGNLFSKKMILLK